MNKNLFFFFLLFFININYTHSAEAATFTENFEGSHNPCWHILSGSGQLLNDTYIEGKAAYVSGNVVYHCDLGFQAHYWEWKMHVRDAGYLMPFFMGGNGSGSNYFQINYAEYDYLTKRKYMGSNWPIIDSYFVKDLNYQKFVIRETSTNVFNITVFFSNGTVANTSTQTAVTTYPDRNFIAIGAISGYQTENHWDSIVVSSNADYNIYDNTNTVFFSNSTDWQNSQINQTQIGNRFYVNTRINDSNWDPSHDYYTLWIYNPDGSLRSNTIDIAAQNDQIPLLFNNQSQTGNYTFKIHSYYWDTFLASAILQVTDVVDCGASCSIIIKIPTGGGYVSLLQNGTHNNLTDGQIAYYANNTWVTLNAIPYAGFAFAYWTVDGYSAPDPPTMLFMNYHSHEVEAHYNAAVQPLPPPDYSGNNTIVYGYVEDNTSYCGGLYCAVPGALVKISNGSYSRQTITNSYGYYQLNFYATGYYNFEISKPGYKTAQYKNEYLSKTYPVNWINFNIQPITSKNYIDGFVEGSDVLTGIYGASIHVYNSTFSRWGTTDNTGYYNISMNGAADIYYNFTISAIGYTTKNDFKHVILGERDYWMLYPNVSTQAAINITTVPSNLGYQAVVLYLDDMPIAMFEGTLLFNARVGTKIKLYAYNSCGGIDKICIPQPAPNWVWAYYTYPVGIGVSSDPIAQKIEWIVPNTNPENITVVFVQYQAPSVINFSWSPNPILAGQSSTISWNSTSNLIGIKYYFHVLSSSNEILDLEIITDSGITHHNYTYTFNRNDNYTAKLSLENNYYDPFANATLRVGSGGGIGGGGGSVSNGNLVPFMTSPNWISGAIIFTAAMAGAAIAGAPGFVGGGAVGTIIVCLSMGLDMVYIFVLGIVFIIMLALYAGIARKTT